MQIAHLIALVLVDFLFSWIRRKNDFGAELLNLMFPDWNS